jgi:hypothetical protein
MKNPSDLHILSAIYHRYVEAFTDTAEKSTESLFKVYHPIDVRAVAKELGMNRHILFGRLYYHLDAKYRYKDDNDVWTHLFAMKVGDQRHCIHIPYLSAIVSEREREWRRYAVSLAVSAIAIVISLISLFVKVHS